MSHVSRRDFLRAGLASSGLWLLAACGPAAPSRAPSKPSEAANAAPSKPSTSSVRILFNVPQDPTFVPDMAAYKRLKEQSGIDSDVQEITGADASIKGLIAGQADLALSSLASGILAVGQGQQIKAAVPSGSAPYFTLVVTADIQDWKALQGKRIGITATSDASYYTTLLQLKKYGVDPNTIDWVTVRGTPARVDAMRAGKIDAGQLTVGAALEIVKEPKFKRFAEIGKDFPNLLFSAYWVNAAFMREHPDVIQAFAEALMQEHRVAQDKARYVATARPLFEGKIDEETISASYDILKEMNVWDPNEARWNNDSGEFTSKTLAEFGAVERYVPFGEWATIQFSEAARQKLGPYKG